MRVARGVGGSRMKDSDSKLRAAPMGDSTVRSDYSNRERLGQGVSSPGSGVGAVPFFRAYIDDLRSGMERRFPCGPARG